MRQFVKLEAFRESLSSVDHDLGLIRVLNASHISGVLNVLSLRKGI